MWFEKVHPNDCRVGLEKVRLHGCRMGFEKVYQHGCRVRLKTSVHMVAGWDLKDHLHDCRVGFEKVPKNSGSFYFVRSFIEGVGVPIVPFTLGNLKIQGELKTK